MYVFGGLRLVFFAVQLATFILVIYQTTFCVYHKPHNFESLSPSCHEALKTVIAIDNRHLNDLRQTNSKNLNMIFEEVIREEEEEAKNSTTLPILKLNTGEIEAASTTTTNNQTTTTRSPVSALNSTSLSKNESSSASPQTEWYHMEFQDERVRINTRTCFQFYFYKTIAQSENSSSSMIISGLMSPVKLNLILIVSSFLLAFLSLIVRYVALKKSSWVQTLLHSLVQFVIWGFLLVNFELFRRSWDASWGDKEAPLYPCQWFIAEILCIVLIALTIFDAFLFNYSDYNIRIEKSQGVYKCIEMKEADVNGTFRSIHDVED